MSALYLQRRYGPADITRLRHDIRAELQACLAQKDDPYYPSFDTRGLDAMHQRLVELREPIGTESELRYAVESRVNRRRYMESIGMGARAQSFQRRTLELLRERNVNAMYLEG